MNLVLGNNAYRHHMTDEGWQLQSGLVSAGWGMVGADDGERDVRKLLKRFNPDTVFVQDKRDWDPSSRCPGATKDLKFHAIQALAKSRARVAVVVKDGGPEGSVYHQRFCVETDADAVVTYYHPMSLFRYCPWLSSYTLIRTHHSINPADVPTFLPGHERRPLCGSGALLKDVYPLRRRVAMKAAWYGMMWLPHPGYKNDKGPDTPRYLSFLNQFKVHFATSSAYGFSLRKIIESVACGCTVVTDLPKYDVLPEIDRALVRVKPTIKDEDLKRVFQEALVMWDDAGRKRWAEKAFAYYDYRAVGKRLSDALIRM